MITFQYILMFECILKAGVRQYTNFHFELHANVTELSLVTPYGDIDLVGNIGPSNGLLPAALSRYLK